MDNTSVSLQEFLSLLIRNLHEAEVGLYRAADAAKAIVAENAQLKARVVELSPPAPVETPAPVDAPPAA